MKVIVPCEFSEVSMNAFSYAYKMFEDAEFTVLHVHSGILSKREPVYLESGMTKDKLLKKEMIRDVCMAVNRNNLPENVTVEVKAGDIIEIINNYVKENQFDLLVSGTRDKYTLFDKVFGTISLGMVKATDIPVIMVPRFAKYKVIDQILFAPDRVGKDVQKFLSLVDKLNTEDPYISFIEIDTSGGKNEIRDDKMKETLAGYKIKYKYGFELIEANDISKSILSVAYNKHSDIIAISPHHQNFIETLLFKSVSKDLILDSKMPLLFVK